MQHQSTLTTQIGDQHKLHGLDHLRALAIISVLCFHYQFFGRPEWESGKISAFGWTGVDLFFVLSGFLISGQLFAQVAHGKGISLKEFFIKRFFRIVPPYALVLCLYLFVPAVREWGRLSPAWKYLTFTTNFGQDLSKYGTFSHAWSLCVEEQFYLLLPLAFWLFSFGKPGRKPFYLIGTLVIAGIIFRQLSWKYFAAPYVHEGNFGLKWNEFVYYPTYNRLDGLLTGVSIAGLFTFYPKAKAWANQYCYAILGLGIVLLFAAWFLCWQYASYNTSTYGFPLISLGYGLVLAAFVSPACIFYRVKSKVTSLIAAWSYAIYLSHKVVIHLVQEALQSMGIDKKSVLCMLICIAAVVTAAVFMRWLIEKPALLARNKVLASLKKEPKIPSPVVQ
jgi:peptidoglycan/LPS O-acetylase OafA/YrhL